MEEGRYASESAKTENIGYIVYVEYCETLDLCEVIEIATRGYTPLCHFCHTSIGSIILMEHVDSREKERDDGHNPEFLTDTIYHQC